MKTIKSQAQKSVNILTTLIAVSILLISTISVSAIDFGGIVKKAAKDAVAELDKSDGKSEDTNTMVKRAKKEIRSAEKKLFSGKKEEAAKQLQAVNKLLEKIEKADPEQKDLKSLNNKYAKLKKNLDKRMKKVATPSSSSSRSASRKVSAKSPTASSGAASAKLPYHAKQKLKQFDNLFRSVEYSFNKLEAAKAEESTTPPDEYAKKIKKTIPELQTILDDAKSVAEEKGASGHPDLLTAQSKIDAIPTKLDKISKELKTIQAGNDELSAGMAGDIETINKAINRLQDKIFNKATGTPIYYNDLKPVKELLVLIDDYDKNDKANAVKVLADFSEKYGATREEVTEKTDDSSAGWNFEKLKKGIENVEKTKAAMADDLVNKANQKVGRLETMHDFYRISEHNKIEEWIEIAQKFDPENEKVKQAKNEIGPLLAADMKKIQKKISDKKWTKNDSTAPKNAKKLAKTALNWFKNSTEWGKRKEKGKENYEILDLVITGPWSIQKKNILGEPICYGLPVKVAIQAESDKEKGLAKVFILTLRTFEERDVKMEPPFEYPTVGDSSYILRKAVK